MKKQKVLSILLTISICLSVFSLSIPAFAEEIDVNAIPEESTAELSAELIATIPETLDTLTVAEKGHSRRAYEEETGLNSAVFENSDGSSAMYLFAQDIKYIDSDGNTVDKSNKLETTSGGYTNPRNNVRINYPNDITQGITVNHEGYTVTMTPVVNNTSSSGSLLIGSNALSAASLITSLDRTEPDRVRYNGVFGSDTYVDYIQQFEGFKEIITLNRYTGQSKFSFNVLTDGLVLAENEGVVEFTDPETNEVVGKFGELLMWDSNERYYTGIYEIETVTVGQKYTVTINASELVNNSKTVFPVYIDPAFFIGQGSSTAIEDTVIYSYGASAASTFGSSTYMNLGATTALPFNNSNQGIGRIFMRFPELVSSTVSNYNTKNATAVYLSVAGYGQEETIRLKTYMSNIECSEGSLYHGNSGWPNCRGEFVSETVYTPNVTTVGESCRFAVDITYAWVQWMSNADIHPSNNGIILQMTNETTEAIRIFSAEDTSTSSRPYVVVEANSYNKDIDMVYRLKSDAMDRYLCVDGALDYTNVPISATLEAEDYQTQYSQLFRFQYDSDADAYRIHPICSKNGIHRVVSSDEGNMIIEPQSTSNSQLFVLDFLGNSVYRIVQSNTFDSNVDPASESSDEQVLTMNVSVNGVFTIKIGKHVAGNSFQKWKLVADYDTYAQRHYYRHMTGITYPISLQNVQANDISSGYGYRSITYGADHAGLDIEVGLGTELLSMWGGEVVELDRKASTSKGNYIAVESNYTVYGTNVKLIFAYIHMNTINEDIIKNGFVEAGDVLGTSGDTTNGTYEVDPHLHITVYTNGAASEESDFSNAIDPLMFFLSMYENGIIDFDFTNNYAS